MHMSNPIAVTFRGRTGTLRVMRNDGYCWGRIVAHDGQQYDVDVPFGDDYYDYSDDHALDLFEIAMDDETLIHPAGAWL